MTRHSQGLSPEAVIQHRMTAFFIFGCGSGAGAAGMSAFDSGHQQLVCAFGPGVDSDSERIPWI